LALWRERACTRSAHLARRPARSTYVCGRTLSRMDIIAILLLVATFASLAGLIELLDRV
jgi:hypothetical protein